MGSRARPVHRAENPAAIWAEYLDNVGFSAFQKHIGLHGLLLG
jgi:hypothetical protein